MTSARTNGDLRLLALERSTSRIFISICFQFCNDTNQQSGRKLSNLEKVEKVSKLEETRSLLGLHLRSFTSLPTGLCSHGSSLTPWSILSNQPAELAATIPDKEKPRVVFDFMSCHRRSELPVNATMMGKVRSSVRISS